MGRRRRGQEPQMRYHAHSGQARVRVYGRVIYLGPWDSPEAKAKYHRLLVEWHGGHEPVPTPDRPRSVASPVVDLPPPPAGLTIAELCLLWLAACEKKYTRADGTTSSTMHECCTIVRALEPDAVMPASGFKARSLIAVQERLVSQGRPRVTVNRTANGIRRLFRWAVMMEHVPPEIVTSLKTVGGHRARSHPSQGPRQPAGARPRSALHCFASSSETLSSPTRGIEDFLTRHGARFWGGRRDDIVHAPPPRAAIASR